MKKLSWIFLAVLALSQAGWAVNPPLYWGAGSVATFHSTVTDVVDPGTLHVTGASTLSSTLSVGSSPARFSQEKIGVSSTIATDISGAGLSYEVIKNVDAANTTFSGGIMGRYTRTITNSQTDSVSANSPNAAVYGLENFIVPTGKTLTTSGLSYSNFFAQATGAPVGTLALHDYALFNATDAAGTNTGTNKYAYYTNGMTGATNNYGFFDAGSAFNTFNGATRIGSTTNATKTLDVTGTFGVSGAATLASTLSVTGPSTLTGYLGIGAAPVNGPLELTTPTTVTGTVTTTASGTTVAGSGTKFQEEFNIGNTITVGGETRTIAAVASDTSMTTDTWTGANSGATATKGAVLYWQTFPNGNAVFGNVTSTSWQTNGVLRSSFMIGTNSPTAAASSGIITPTLSIFGYGGAGSATVGSPQLDLIRSNGNEASPAVISTNQSLGRIVWRGARSTTAYASSALIDVQATEVWNNTSAGSQMFLEVTPNGTTSAVTALTLGQDGSATFASTAGATFNGPVGAGGTAFSSSWFNATGTNPGSQTTGRTFYNNVTYPATTTSGGSGFRDQPSTVASAFTMTEYDAFLPVGISIGAASAVTTQYDFKASQSTAASNNITLGDGSGNPSGNWFIFQGATKANSLAGPVTMSNAAIKMTGITTGTNADTVCLKADGTLLIQAAACTISSRRFKEDISYLWEAPKEMSALDVIMALKPVEFRMKEDPNHINADINYHRLQVGLIAEDVEKVDRRLALYDQDGVTPKSYRQESVIATLVGAVKEQQAEIVELRAQIKKIKDHR